MVIDTSALVVVLLDEPNAARIAAAIEAAPVRLLSAANLLDRVGAEPSHPTTP
jgi:uncharacterized protein with PIN domain